MLSSTKFSYRCASTTTSSVFTEGWLAGAPKNRLEVVLIVAILVDDAFDANLDCPAAMARRSKNLALVVVVIVL